MRNSLGCIALVTLLSCVLGCREEPQGPPRAPRPMAAPADGKPLDLPGRPEQPPPSAVK